MNLEFGRLIPAGKARHRDFNPIAAIQQCQRLRRNLHHSAARLCARVSRTEKKLLPSSLVNIADESCDDASSTRSLAQRL